MNLREALETAEFGTLAEDDHASAAQYHTRRATNSQWLADTHKKRADEARARGDKSAALGHDTLHKAAMAALEKHKKAAEFHAAEAKKQ